MALFPGESEKNKRNTALDLALAKLAINLLPDTLFNRKTAAIINAQIRDKEKELPAGTGTSNQNHTS
jgi:hypothetical protein